MAKKSSKNTFPPAVGLENRSEASGSEIIIYQTQNGANKVDVQLVDETVWLTQSQICELFQKAKSTISEHIKNIFEEGELDENSVVRNFRTTASDGKNFETAFYNLDVIISVGYRVKSQVGTHFRIWATQRLREYIIKGFVLDDERLKKARNSYFDELLARIRDIRSSERVFYRKVCDIFATSINYNAQTELAKTFFASVQNKFHWAILSSTNSSNLPNFRLCSVSLCTCRTGLQNCTTSLL